MTASKAYLAGLGTTGVLLAAAIVLLFLVGALVGFDRWPGGDLGERVERVQVRPGEEPLGLAAAVTAPDAVPAAAGTIPVAAPPVAGGGPAPTGDARPPVLGDRDSGGAPAAPAPGGGGLVPPAPVDGVVGIDPGNPGTARDVVADTTQQATQRVGGAVGTVSPEAGALVTGIGDGISDQIRAVPLKPAAP